MQPSAWIAGTDSGKEGDWRWNPDNTLFWTGGRSGHGMSGVYTHWSQNNPADSTTNNCAMILNDSGGYWYPNWCQAQNAWVCEGPDKDPQLPDLHDCTTLNNADGLWSGVLRANRPLRSFARLPLPTPERRSISSPLPFATTTDPESRA